MQFSWFNETTFGLFGHIRHIVYGNNGLFLYSVKPGNRTAGYILSLDKVEILFLRLTINT